MNEEVHPEKKTKHKTIDNIKEHLYKSLCTTELLLLSKTIKNCFR